MDLSLANDGTQLPPDFVCSRRHTRTLLARLSLLLLEPQLRKPRAIGDQLDSKGIAIDARKIRLQRLIGRAAFAQSVGILPEKFGEDCKRRNGKEPLLTGQLDSV